MIGFLTGTMAARSAEGCFVDVGGIGYKVTCSATTMAALPTEGEPCKLWTHTHVREDALALFGFATEGEQRMFEALISVSGVGPKVALQICSAFAPDALRRALATDDIPGISSVPGIGKKTAQRIVLELKEKLSVPDLHIAGTQPDTLSKARSALENLGYSPSEVRTALGELDVTTDDDVQDVIKSALRALA